LPTRGLDNSRTGQVADWTTRGCHRRLSELSFPFLAASARPLVVQSATCPDRELAIRELAYPRGVQLPHVAPMGWNLAWRKYCDQYVCLCVFSLSARISPEPQARSLPIFCACCLCPRLGPPPARWR